MSSRTSMMDEFESVFKSSVRPHVEIEPLRFERLLMILDCYGAQEKRQAVVACAADLVDRHKQLETRVVAPCRPEHSSESAEGLLAEAVAVLARVGGDRVSGQVIGGSPHRVILDNVKDFAPSMILMSSLFGENDEDLETYTLGSVTDRVLSEVSEPVLLIEGKVDDVGRMWSDILVYVEDQKTAHACLAATRTLALKEANTHLLHVIDSEWLTQIGRAVELASELDSGKTKDAIVRSLERDMEHYLTAAAEALERTGHRAATFIEVGDPIDLTRRQIWAGDHRLLICNSVAPDQKLIDSIAYNLAAYMREIPLLLV
ncbi:MAG: universal stress protein [Vulcanimicrobiota bacterium]